MNTQSWKNATPQQLNLWRHVKGLIAYSAITPLYFQGAIAASEFLTYNAGKLYFCLECEFGQLAGATTITNYVAFYNEANVNNFAAQNNSIVWDTTAAQLKYQYFTTLLQNLYFSRITITSGVTMMRFNGYRLNV